MKAFLQFALVAYVFINAVGLLTGWVSGVSSDPRDNLNCTMPASRIVYVFPGFQVGCWLSKPIHRQDDR